MKPHQHDGTARLCLASRKKQQAREDYSLQQRQSCFHCPSHERDIGSASPPLAPDKAFRGQSHLRIASIIQTYAFLCVMPTRARHSRQCYLAIPVAWRRSQDASSLFARTEVNSKYACVVRGKAALRRWPGDTKRICRRHSAVACSHDRWSKASPTLCKEQPEPYVEQEWRRQHKRQATHHTRFSGESSMHFFRPQNALHATL